MLSGKLLVAVGVLIAALATFTSAIADTAMPGIERDVTLREKAETWSPTVCLQDLVEDGWIQGRCAVDRGLCCKWTLGTERARTFTRAELQRELARTSFSGFDLKLKGAERVAVTQTRRELTTAELQAKIIAAAAARFGDDGRGAGVASLKAQAPIYVSLADESAWDVIVPEPLLEHASIKVVSTAEGGQALGWVQATLRLDADVYVARKTVHPGDLLKPEDFEVRKANVLAAQASGQTAFRKEQFPEAVRAKTTILAGQPLTPATIERIPMVRLGDTVTLILRSDSLKISTKGVVQGAAAIGDMVTVQLQRYNRTFRGRLIEGRLVEVWL
ncbi:MAG: flagellar basal body P-ring formation protein FlgA [Deltaproteobacteria bacterium]|nr:flagellar basal body P-ring formation protein FlgA [Deltaproteobacteria bacterium]